MTDVSAKQSFDCALITPENTYFRAVVLPNTPSSNILLSVGLLLAILVLHLTLGNHCKLIELLATLLYRYDNVVTFLDPITKYNNVQGYMFNIRMLKAGSNPAIGVCDLPVGGYASPMADSCKPGV